MIPILFQPNATTFTSNGVGRLSDAISCTVHEARNGEFELEMAYPVDGAHYCDIVHSAIIVAMPSARRSNQAFRIYKITKPMNGQVTVLARHISYQLSFIPVSPFSASNLANALSGFKTNAAEACPFTLEADFSSSSSYAVPLPTGIRAYLGGQRGSILDVYGGEWEWDNYNCILHKARGHDNGYLIMYGKNLVDLKQEQNIEETYTGIYPYWRAEETMVTLPEKVIHSGNAALYPFQRTLVKDFSDVFENAPSAADLRLYTESYIQANKIGIPNVNLTIDFINVADLEEYRGLLTSSNLDLCDTVTVRFQKLGVDVKSKVVEIEWDVLRDRYSRIELGDRRSTLATTIEDQMEQISLMPTMDEMHRNIDRATGVLNAGTRGHVIINRNPEGWANEILFLDNENIALAKNVLRINMNGIGFSSDGYNGHYYQSWTLDGFLSLGGVNNAYGTLQILDTSGKLICSVSKDGYTIYDNDGQTVIGQWAHSGISLRKGIIDFNWGKNTVGFYADGTKVQIGDWIVDSGQSYGRAILQSTDEVTGMSAETDDPDLLYFWAGYHGDDDYVFLVNGSDAYVMYKGGSSGSNIFPIGQTLAELKEDVEDLKQRISSDESDDPEEPEGI